MLEMRHAGKVYPGGAVALEDINVHIKESLQVSTRISTATAENRSPWHATKPI